MARGFVIRTRLRCPPDRVWAQLVDPAVRAAGHRSTGHDGGEAVVTEFEPKRSYALASRRRDLLTTYRYTLRGSHHGTELVMRLICAVDGRWWPAHSLAVIALWARDRGRLWRLKRELEAEAAG